MNAVLLGRSQGRAAATKGNGFDRKERQGRKAILHHKVSMSLGSSAEHEKGEVLRLVIDADAGIQAHLPAELAWIPAFAGMTGRPGRLSSAIHPATQVFSKEDAKSAKFDKVRFRMRRDLRGEKFSAYFPGARPALVSPSTAPWPMPRVLIQRCWPRVRPMKKPSSTSSGFEKC